MTTCKRKGASLIELLITSFILGVGVMGVFSLWNYVLQIVQNQHTVSVAGQLARADLEEVKVRGFDNLPKGVVQNKTFAVWQGSPVYFTAAGTRQGGTLSGTSFFSLDRRIEDTNVIQDLNGTTYVLSPQSTRTVTTTVRRVRDNEVVTRMTTVLTRGGV